MDVAPWHRKSRQQVELLTHTGRSLPEVMMMLVPEAWEKNPEMSKNKKIHIRNHIATMMEGDLSTYDEFVNELLSTF